ncbi:MAG: type III pantothenate kinase [Firmicutes bacterium HGW-Firmicutes-19]|jgi:type III pantothenate kinase|nr:MAG: type III pantothenate kinase [Firmicutes bacterium HGW-Firmicutes-19]
MLLTIDVGNSNLVAVVFDEHRNRVFDERIVTQKQNVIAYYEEWLIRLLGKLSHLNAIDGVIFSSVVPSITDDIVSIIKDKTGLDPMIVSADIVKEFVIHLEQRSHLGADFIATSYGAMADYSLPAIVADLGSATKISVLNAKGEFEGGVIVPGVGISVEALVGFIKHLPEIELKVPEKVIGKNTILAMQSGLLYGVIASVEGLADRIENELGQPITRLLTGGYAKIVNAHMPKFVYDEFLLNNGLYEIYQKKRGNL